MGDAAFADGYARWVKGLAADDADRVTRALRKAKGRKPDSLIAMARTMLDDPPEQETPPPRVPQWKTPDELEAEARRNGPAKLHRSPPA